MRAGWPGTVAQGPAATCIQFLSVPTGTQAVALVVVPDTKLAVDVEARGPEQAISPDGERVVLARRKDAAQRLRPGPNGGPASASGPSGARAALPAFPTAR